MSGMHLAIFSPKTGKLKELKVAGMPHNGNMDPAFVRQDSYGYLWLGTMRDGLYFMDMKKQYMRRVNLLLSDDACQQNLPDEQSSIG